MKEIQGSVGTDLAGREAICRDAICEREKGENYENCPEDCVPENGSENILRILKRQENLWIIKLLPLVLIILIAVVIIILRHKRGR